MLFSKRVCKLFPREERYLLHPTILVVLQRQAEIADNTCHLVGETPGKSGKLEQRVEDLFREVARRFLRTVRLLDGWNALRKTAHVSKSRQTCRGVQLLRRTVTKSISWARQKGLRIYKLQPIQSAKKRGMLMYAVRKSCEFHWKKTW
jgi:hypothetical protein